MHVAERETKDEPEQVVGGEKEIEVETTGVPREVGVITRCRLLLSLGGAKIRGRQSQQHFLPSTTLRCENWSPKSLPSLRFWGSLLFPRQEQKTRCGRSFGFYHRTKLKE